jgi:hypothetical protein
MAMPFTTPLSTAQSDNQAELPRGNEDLLSDPNVKGLEDVPEAKKPRTLWQKIKHSFD